MTRWAQTVGPRLATESYMVIRGRAGDGMNWKDALHEVATLPEAEPWRLAVIYNKDSVSDLSGSDISIWQMVGPGLKSADTLEEFEAVMADVRFYEFSLEKRSLRTVANLLHNLPEEQSVPMLWALTTLLNDERQVDYSRSEPAGLLGREMISGTYPPIRAMARERLVANLGVDHKYDIAAWQDEIIARATDSEGD
jgi:hypothetical protein